MGYEVPGALRADGNGSDHQPLAFLAVAVYLIRHANAGTRGGYPGPDDDRPLSAKGRERAEHIVSLLADRPIGKIVSSPAARCVQTVAPLAVTLGITVDCRPELAEGRSADDVITLLAKHAHRDVVACAHGDVIPKVIRTLTQEGMRVKGKDANQKGCVWEIEVEDGRFTRARYHPPSSDQA